MKRLAETAILFVAAALFSGTGVAADTPSAISDADQLQAVVVSAKRVFLSEDTSGTTNLPVPVDQVPQSISLVTQDFMKTADLRTLADVAEYTPGATQAGAPENIATAIKLRGFGAGVNLDGLDAPAGGFDDEYALYDRAEFVEGPSSVVYGAGSPGGLVNWVTKRGPDHFEGYARMDYGSWDTSRFEGQVGGPLDDSGSLRGLTLAAVEKGNSYIDQVEHSNYLVYADLDGNFGDSVKAYVNGAFRHDSRTGFDGVPAQPDGYPAAVSRAFYIGSPLPIFKTNSDGYFINSGISWRASEQLTLKLRGNFSASPGTGGSPFGSGLDQFGNFTLAVDGPNRTKSQNYNLGAWAVYDVTAFGLEDSFVSASLLYQNERQLASTDFWLMGGSQFVTANLFGGEGSIEQILNSGVDAGFAGALNQYFSFTTASVQTFLKPIKKLSVLLGVSRSKPNADVTSYDPTGAETASNFDFSAKTSYRAGLVYEFVPRVNAYVSFSQSFLPQTVTDINNAPLPPLTGEQYEAGIKTQAFGNRLLLTTAVYQITQANAAEFDTFYNGSDRYLPIGEVRHRGVELAALGNITPNWQINFGYSLLDAKVTEDSDPTTIGKDRPFLPRHAASLFTIYRIPSGVFTGLSLGGGGRYLSSEPTSTDGSTVPLHGYGLVDAVASYDTGPWSIQMNVRNIFNKLYYTSNWDTLYYGLYPGAPINGTLSVTRRF